MLPADHAMLFDFGSPRPVSMWMKNTYISLDMVFIRSDGTVAGFAADTVPQSLDDHRRAGTGAGVLELAAGTARRIGLKTGDTVSPPHLWHRRVTNRLACGPGSADATDVEPPRSPVRHGV